MNINRREFFKWIAVVGGGLAAPWMGPLYATIPRDDPPPWEMGPEWLELWKRARKIPVYESKSPVVRGLIAAAENRAQITFYYDGGSTPGTPRRVSPAWLFEAEGFPGLYLGGFCHTREEERTFSVARIQVIEYQSV